MNGAAYQQLESRSHGPDIRTNIDGVGYEQQAYGCIEHPSREMLPEALRQTVSRDPPHPGADFLDATHQRIGKYHGP